MRFLFKRREERNSTKGILVLVYHSYHPYFAHHFEEHIQYLKRYCHLLTPQDFCDLSSSGGDTPGRSVLITLDDGLPTDYSVAYPILRKHGVSAIAFVMTDPYYYTDIPGKDWWKEVEGVMEIGSHTASHAEIFVSNRPTDFLVPIDGEVKKIYAMLKGVRYIPGFPLFERGPELIHRQVFVPEALVRVIQESVGGVDFFGQEGWRETLEAIVHDDYTYAVETDEAKEERIRGELVQSKIEIEKITGRPCRMLAYPWGAYNEEVVRIAKEARYQFAFTAKEGLVFPGDPPLELHRVNVPLMDSGVSIEAIFQLYFH